MSDARPVAITLNAKAGDECCTPQVTSPMGLAAPGERDAGWLRAARWARRLAWFSLVWMAVEGAVGLWQGLSVGSIALVGWAFGSVVEGAASIIVIWRFSGRRTLSDSAEQGARRAVAVSFWLLAPYVAAESVRDLVTGHHAETTVVGMAVTGLSLLAMPLLGQAKHRLAARLGSAATAGEGTQNYLCAGQAAAVLAGLAVTATWSAGWWIDPVIALGIAGAALWEGLETWRGDDCC